MISLSNLCQSSSPRPRRFNPAINFSRLSYYEAEVGGSAGTDLAGTSRGGLGAPAPDQAFVSTGPRYSAIGLGAARILSVVSRRRRGPGRSDHKANFRVRMAPASEPAPPNPSPLPLH